MPALNEITVSEIIMRSTIPDIDYEINPYVGCSYKCLYCYSKYLQDHSEYPEPWGSFIDVKINAADLIDETSQSYVGREIFIGSITDPYLPCEQEYLITRKILEKLVALKPSLAIQTKSDLVLRDTDLFKKFDRCEVGMTITTLDDSLRAEVENAAATVDQRLKALRQLKSLGIHTYVFIGPLLPELTDWKAIIDETCGFVNYYVVELLNIEGDIWPAIKNWLQEKHPELVATYKTIYFSDNSVFKPVNRFFWRYFGNSVVASDDYRTQLYDEIQNYAHQKQVQVVFNDLLY